VEEVKSKDVVQVVEGEGEGEREIRKKEKKVEIDRHGIT